MFYFLQKTPLEAVCVYWRFATESVQDNKTVAFSTG